MPVATATAPVTARNVPPSGSTAKTTPDSGSTSGAANAATWPVIAAIPATTAPAPQTAMPTPTTVERAGRATSRPASALSSPTVTAVSRPTCTVFITSPAGQPAERLDDRLGTWRAAGDLQIDRQDVADGPGDPVGVPEHPAVAGAVTHGDNEFRAGHGLVSALERLGHVQRDGPGDQQRVGVPGGGHQPRAVPLGVVDRPECGGDLDFAAVARAGVHMRD